MRRSAAALLFVVLTTSCTLDTDYFKEYRGRNLLGNYGFEATGKWNYVETTTPTDFMAWETATADTAINSFGSAYTTGPDGSSPAYHLEIKNLIANGDFEAAVGSEWALESAGSGTLSIMAAATSTLLPTRYLNWVGTPGSNVYLDVNAALTSPTAWRNRLYRLKADYFDASSGNSAVYFTLTSGLAGISDIDWDTTFTLPVSQTTLLDKNISVTSSGTDTRRFWIGRQSSSQTFEVALDNLRLLPDDGTLYVKATLSSLSSGVMKLLPGSKVGMYTLTLYVRDDPTTLAAGAVDGSGLVKNRFQAQNLTVKVTAAVKSGSREPDPTVFARTAAWGTGWTKLTMNFGFDFYDTDAEVLATGKPALTIALSPTVNQSDTVDVGSLLVAQPVLTYNP